jgi:plastocyanin domain-containing protein
VNNVSIVAGKQIIEIRAKGGYLPVHSVAKADMPTTLRVNTSGTFDCSSSIRIPSLNISRNLPMSGVTDIDLGVPKIGMFYGTCGMGMYPFDIKFE